MLSDTLFRVPRGQGLQLLQRRGDRGGRGMFTAAGLVLLPYGYHPAAAPPGYRLYYLWALAGEQRQLAVYEDPAYRWVHNAVS